MTTAQKVTLLLLRVSLGWIFLYAGISHLTNPNFSKAVAGYLGNAQILHGFFSWLASPSFLPALTPLNAWGLTIIGICVILGLFTRVASILGALLMLAYYLPLGILHPNEHALIVDEHVVYMAGFLVLALFRAGRAYGLDHALAKRNGYRLG
jgi:thiosulfate dehydrogenase [quinone] large subunit